MPSFTLIPRQTNTNPFGPAPGGGESASSNTEGPSLSSGSSPSKTHTSPSTTGNESSPTSTSPSNGDSGPTSTSDAPNQTSQVFASETSSTSQVSQFPPGSQSTDYFATAITDQSSSLSSMATSSIIPSSSPTAVTNLVQQQRHRTAIVGGVVGGLVTFAILLFAGYMALRKRRKLRRAEASGSNPENDRPKTYWNLDKQEGEASPPGFFPKEYTGAWPEVGSPKPRSSPRLI